MLSLPPLKRSTSLSEAVDVINAWQEQKIKNMQARQVKYDLLYSLISLRKNITQGNFDSTRGICHNIVSSPYSKIWRELYVLFAKWPENYSQNREWPVPDYWAYNKRSNLYAYYHHTEKWSRFKSYGRARRRLLNWMIRELSEELKP